MIDLVGFKVSVARHFAQENHLELTVKEVYSNTVKKDIIMKQSIEKGRELNSKEHLTITVSKGKDRIKEYQKYNVNELGDIPVILYHGVEKSEFKTKQSGGTTDKEGLVRTVDAFKDDLKYYYDHDYRMIRADDMVNGTIDVPLGKSPIVLTFDGGYESAIKVLGEKKDGTLEIDPDSAVGILESYKKKYPDFQVTATFFFNNTLFQQNKYNKMIVKWLVQNGYDIGNGTLTGVDITTLDYTQTEKEIGAMYHTLNELIPEKYVSIVALPGGSPYQVNHRNYSAILDGTYQKQHYQSFATFASGSSASPSCYSNQFSTDFIKRIKASNQMDQTDSLKSNLELLETTKYISDGEKDQVVYKKVDQEKLNPKIKQEVLSY